MCLTALRAPFKAAKRELHPLGNDFRVQAVKLAAEYAFREDVVQGADQVRVDATQVYNREEVQG